MGFVITSDAFSEGGLIPSKYTCDGQNTSPPLLWYGAPSNTQSFALISDDPDAPVGTWIHWIVFNMPATATGLPEAVPPSSKLSDGSLQGRNSWPQTGYGGPCPPSGTHRYFFKLYALDQVLALPAGATKEELLSAMKGHVLAESQLMGKYARIR